MYEKELKTGIEAVKAAMKMSRVIQSELTSEGKMDKSDKSPVTVADFAAQAVICSILKRNFPDIPVVGEEDSEDLKNTENSIVLDQIKKYLDKFDMGEGFLFEDDIFKSIDLGNGDAHADLFWTLDPIDGTKGFLRGEQYAIALALIRNGKVVLGINGCPNLQLEDHSGVKGFIAGAVKDEGTILYDQDGNEIEKISVSKKTDPSEMRFVESYVSAHGNQDLQESIAKTLRIGKPPVQLDSQVKYTIVGSGNAEIYLRIPNPKSPDYKEKIWDHAAGSLIVREAGGIVTDIDGKELDFSRGKRLVENRGILACIPLLHPKVVSIVKSS